MTTERRSFLKKTVIVITGSIGRMVLSAGVGLAIAQLIGPSAKGTLSVLMVIGSLMSLVLAIGMPGTTTYMLGSGRWMVRDVLGVMLVLVGTCFILPLPLTRYAVDNWDYIGSLKVVPYWVIPLSGLLLALQAVLAGSLNGLQRYSRVALVSILLPTSNVIAFVLLLGMGVPGGRSAVYSWMISLLVGDLAGLVLLILGSVRPLPRWPSEMGYAMKYGFRTLAGNAIGYANLRLDVLILAPLAGLAATGSYSVAVAATELLWSIPMAVGTVVFPSIAATASSHTGGDWTARVCRITLFVTVVLSGVLAVVGAVLFTFVMTGYHGAVSPLLLLLPGTVGLTVARVVGNDLLGRAKPEAHIYAGAAGLVFTLVFGVALIPRLGASGAALASTLAYSAYAFVVVRIFEREAGIGWRELFVIRRDDFLEMRTIVVRLMRGLRSALS